MLCRQCGEDRKRSEFGRRRKVCKRCRRKSRQMRLYGLTEAQIEVLTAYGDECAICHVRVENPKSLHVDHDHKTGNVRGLLCSNCNAVVGMVESGHAIDVGAIVRYIEGANLNLTPRPREVRQSDTVPEAVGQQWLF